MFQVREAMTQNVNLGRPIWTSESLSAAVSKKRFDLIEMMITEFEMDINAISKSNSR
jgi:hypothetical protein